MMKKIICIICVLSVLFLTSCKKDEEVTTTVPKPSEVISSTELELESESESEGETETVTAVEVQSGKYNLTKTRKDNLTDKEYDAYKIIIDGLDNAQTEISVDLSGKNSYSRVKSALWSGYPLIVFVQDMHYASDEKVLKVIYSDSQDYVRSRIDAFYRKVNSILTMEILYMNDFSKALLLYDYISNCIPSDDVTLTVYDLITDGKGTQLQFSTAYEYLLSLAGVESVHITGENWDTNQLAMTAVKLGENYYYMSPYNEAKENSGKMLQYFGMTEERAKAKTENINFFSIDNDYNRTTPPPCTDSTYDFTEFSENWSLDRESQELTYEITDHIYKYKF